jgi:hypothetical protein
MSIRYHKGYWTIFSKGKPVLACESFKSAWSAVYALYAEFDLS